MKINGLAATSVVFVMMMAGGAVSGETQAAEPSEQAISGDSGSANTALSAKEAQKQAKRAQKQAEKAKRKAEKAARKAEKKAAREAKKEAKNAGKEGAQASSSKKKKSPLICKREKVSGSHMRQKVCRTQEQIDAQREADQRMIRDINPAGGVTPG